MHDNARNLPEISRPGPLQNTGSRAGNLTDELVIQMWLFGKAANTRAAYERDLMQFLDFTGQPLQTITLAHLQEWADELTTLGRARATRARKLAAIKSLLSFAQTIGYIAFNVGAAVPLPKVPDELAQRILPENDIKRIINGEMDVRNNALLRLFYASGGRVSELAPLRWEHVIERHITNARRAQILLDGKGGKTRNIILSEDTYQCLAYLHRLEINDGYGVSQDPVFRSRKGGHISRQQIWRIVRQAARRVGIDKPVSPHWFRHAHASHALDHGAPAHLVKDTLGHTSLATTSKYAHARPNDSSGDYLSL
jgi:integrase/recombinase XerD